jgi:glucuronokinase
LVGNPSDGYFGKTIALSFSNFRAEVVLYETPELEILPCTRDHSVFSSIHALSHDVDLFGYYGGLRLLKAAIKRFRDYCGQHNLAIHDRNFTIRYQSSIPHLVGLAGSSAIITACMRCLMEFYEVRISRPELANLILTVETEELGINAGLQDRVAQVYQGLVYMDFDKELMETRGYGDYVQLDASLLPPLYIAYRDDLSEGSERVHSKIRERFQRGDDDIIGAIAFWRSLASEVRERIEAGEGGLIGSLLDANFDKRAEISPISEGNTRMIDAARSVGASAKFTGSGGAIIGAYEDENMFQVLKEVLEPLDISVIKPKVAPAT